MIASGSLSVTNINELSPDRDGKNKSKDKLASEPYTPFSWSTNDLPNTEEKKMSIGSPNGVRAVPRIVPPRLNKDLSLYENLDQVEDLCVKVILPHCPFCMQRIDRTTQPAYAINNDVDNNICLAHPTCVNNFRKNQNPHSATNNGLIEPSRFKIANRTYSSDNFIDTSHFFRIGTKATILMSLEFFHPLSNTCFGRFFKTMTPLEHSESHSKIAFVALKPTVNSPALFEPNIVAIPCHDFRATLSVYIQSNAEPFVFEFHVNNLSTFHTFGDRGKTQPLQIHSNKGQNNVSLNCEITNDNEVLTSMNYKSPLLTTNEHFLVIRQVVVTLPLIHSMDKPRQPQTVDTNVQNPFILNSDLHLVSSPDTYANGPSSPYYSPYKTQISSPQNPDSQEFTDQTSNNSIPRHHLPVPPSKFKPSDVGSPPPQQKEFTKNVPINMASLQAIPKPLQEEGASPGKIARGALNSAIVRKTLTEFLNTEEEAGHEKGPGDGFDQDNGVEDNLQKAIQKTLLDDSPKTKPNVFMLYSPQPEHRSPVKDPSGATTMKNMTGIFGSSQIQHPQSGPGTRVSSAKSTPMMAPQEFNPNLSSEQKQALYFRAAANIPPPTSSPPVNQFTASGSKVNTRTNRLGSMDGGGNRPYNPAEIENIHDVDIVSYAKNKEGSRLLQRFYPKATVSDMDYVVNSIGNHLLELMTNQYANFMFKNLAQACTDDQRYRLLQKLAPVIGRVAQDSKGTHALQSLINLVKTEEEEIIIEAAIKDHVDTLVADSQATHFIQKIVTIFSMKHVEIIYTVLINNFVGVARHQYGLCVLKTMMLKVKDNQAKVKQIIELLTNNAEVLVQDPFGNYAIQYAFEQYPRSQLKGIMDKVLANIVLFSLQKFASNVVETCISNSLEQFAKVIATPTVIIELMKNKYGNFVLQKALKESKDAEYELLYNSVSANLSNVNLRKYKDKWNEFLEMAPKRALLDKYLNSQNNHDNNVGYTD